LTITRLAAYTRITVTDDLTDAVADDQVDAEPEAGGEQAPQGNGDSRLRSTIAFPYGSLKDAEQIANALQSSWGGSATPEQLAAGMDASPKSGAFRTKVATARTFGIVDVTRGKVSLSDLGRRIIDPQTQAATRVQAFLGVPLFAAIHAEYKNGLLPPDVGLEQKMADLGVSPKQTAKARQALVRSAEQAGFCKHGRTRLVEPPSGLADSQHADQHGKRERHERQEQNPVMQAGMPDPFQAAWFKLLDEGQSWPAEKTHEFVEMIRKMRELLAKT